MTLVGWNIVIQAMPTFVLTFFRIAGITLLAPLLGSEVIDPRIKIGFSLLMAIIVWPIVPPVANLPESLPALALAIGSEMLIGLLIGLGATLTFVALELAGLIVGQQLGLSLAGVFNPFFESQSSELGQFYFLFSLVVFLLIDGHHMMIGALIDSFSSIPLAGLVLDERWLNLLASLLEASFKFVIQVTAPALASMFLVSVGMGFIGRTMPQLNILAAGFPLRLLVGMTVLVTAFAALTAAFETSVTQALYEISEALKLGR